MKKILLLFLFGLISLSSCQRIVPGTGSKSSITVNVADLDHFAREKPDVLKRFLLASPDWEVTELYGGGLRFTRSDQSIEEQSPFGSGGGIEIWHPEYIFLFSKDKPVEHGVRSPVTVTGPIDGTVSVTVTKNANTFNSTVAIGGAGLWFEFFERTSHQDRRRTQKAVEWLKSFLAQVRLHESEIEQNGFVTALTSTNTAKVGTSSFSAETKHLDPEEAVDQASIHNIDAWFNTGEAGVAYLKAFNESTGKPMGPTDRSRKHVAYATNQQIVFRYQDTLAIREGASYGIYKARFELWFKPDSGAPERKLFEKTLEIQGWYR